MEWEWKFTRMQTFTSAVSQAVSEMGRVRWFGQILLLMELHSNIMLENGKMESRMDKVFIALKIGTL